jgi:hypothetical protein
MNQDECQAEIRALVRMSRDLESRMVNKMQVPARPKLSGTDLICDLAAMQKHVGLLTAMLPHDERVRVEAQARPLNHGVATPPSPAGTSSDGYAYQPGERTQAHPFGRRSLTAECLAAKGKTK